MLNTVILGLPVALMGVAGGVTGLAEQRCDACSTTADAVQLASGQEGALVAARRYVFEVRSIEERADVVYLNSQRQARDQLNVSLALTPQVADALRTQLATDNLARALRGQRLVVTGQAQRVRVNMGNTETIQRFYYYHTQIAVTEIRQIARFASS